MVFPCGRETQNEEEKTFFFWSNIHMSVNRCLNCGRFLEKHTLCVEVTENVSVVKAYPRPQSCSSVRDPSASFAWIVNREVAINLIPSDLSLLCLHYKRWSLFHCARHRLLITSLLLFLVTAEWSLVHVDERGLRMFRVKVMREQLYDPES